MIAEGDAGQVLYRVRREPVDASARWPADPAASWDRRLVALRRAAEAA